MMQAVMTGASCLPEELVCRQITALEATLDDLFWADGLLLGTPENFGYMSGALKHFFDCTYYPAQGKTNGLPYSMFISAGNDGTGAALSIRRIANGYGWREVMQPLICPGELKSKDLETCQEFGEMMAAGLICGRF